MKHVKNIKNNILFSFGVIMGIGGIMQIIKFQKLNDNRYKLSFKDSESLILYDDIILKYNLLNQKNIDNTKYQEIKKANDELASYYQAIKYLGIKMRCQKEITTYLKKKGFLNNTIIKTLNRLEQEGYVDEEKYIHYYILDQINLTLNGPLKIKNSLINLDLNKELIEQELALIDYNIWQDRIAKILKKRLKSNKDSKQIFIKKNKEYLYKNGYSYEMTNPILSSLKIEEDDNFEKTAFQFYQKLSKKYDNEKLKYYLKNKLYAKGYSIDKINEFVDKI